MEFLSWSLNLGLHTGETDWFQRLVLLIQIDDLSPSFRFLFTVLKFAMLVFLRSNIFMNGSSFDKSAFLSTALLILSMNEHTI